MNALLLIGVGVGTIPELTCSVINISGVFRALPKVHSVMVGTMSMKPGSAVLCQV